MTGHEGHQGQHAGIEARLDAIAGMQAQSQRLLGLIAGRLGVAREEPGEPAGPSREDLIAELVGNRARQLRKLIRESEALSAPVDPGHWRWADTELDGYTRKSPERLAADRAYYARRAAELRRELAVLTGKEETT